MFVIYDKETTRILKRKGGSVYSPGYKSKGAATRAFNQLGEDQPKYAIAEQADFHKNIELMETRRNFMTGKEFQERVNAPWATSAASETYWSS